MKEDVYLVYVIGFTAQLFFSARMLIQWMMTERRRYIVSPIIFWILSIAGAYLLCIYGWLRNDILIVFGQLVSYYIYSWNLLQKGVRVKKSYWLRVILLCTPLLLVVLIYIGKENRISSFFYASDIPLGLFMLGFGGQLVLILRFVYQMMYSIHHKASMLPIGFWVISLIGALIILIYGCIRHDPVLIVGQVFALIVYLRNITIGFTIKEQS